MLILIDFSAYVGIVSGMFSLFVDCWSYRLFHFLQGTMDIMVLIPCFLILASNKLGGVKYGPTRNIYLNLLYESQDCKKWVGFA
jgi:hypothetical protein